MNIDIPDDAIRKAITSCLLGERHSDRPLEAMARQACAGAAPELERIFATEFMTVMQEIREPVRAAIREAIIGAATRAGERIGATRAKAVAKAATMFEKGGE